MEDGRIKAEIVRSRTRWGIAALWVLLNQYPDDEDDGRVFVQVEDRANHLSWKLPVKTAREARELRNRVEHATRTMSEAEIDEWSRTGRWSSV